MASMVPCILDSSVEYNAMLQEPKSRGREEGREEREGTVILVDTLGRPGVRLAGHMHKEPLQMRNGANDSAMTAKIASVWKAPGFSCLSRGWIPGLQWRETVRS